MEKLIAWVEIPANDCKRAVEFYNTVLKTDLEVVNCGEEKMACFPNNEGAIFEAPGFKPSKDGVLVSFNTPGQLDETLAAVEKAGGEVVKPKTKIDAEGRGYFALFIDSEGNKIGLYSDR